MTTDQQPPQTGIAVRPPEEDALVGAFDLGTIDPIRALKKAEEVVTFMAQKCTGAHYIASISGRKYPKVDWWTTVGMGLGLFPVEVSSERIADDDEHVTYLAVVEVRRAGQTITRASAICGSRERTWANRDEYAIKSMATTRATGKAYRIGLSGLAVMAGLEATPAEEMPTAHEQPEAAASAATSTGFGAPRMPASHVTAPHGVCEKHNVPWFLPSRGGAPGHYFTNSVGVREWCRQSKPKDSPPPIAVDVGEGWTDLGPGGTMKPKETAQ